MERANIAELARKWSVSRKVVYTALKAGRIPGAEFIDGKWYVPEDTEILATTKPGYISTTEAAKKWGATIYAVCAAAKAGRIPGAELIAGRWNIPADLENPLKLVMDPLLGYISTREAATKWGVFQTDVCREAQAGRIPGAEYIGNRWNIPEDAVYPVDGKTVRMPGYTSASKTAAKWGVSINSVCCAAKGGRIPGAKFIGGRWRIPEDIECPIVRREKKTP